MTLKDICRSVIRVQLRKKAEIENPSISLKNGSKNKTNIRKNRPNNSVTRPRRPVRRCNRRVIIPIFEESDATSDETSSNASHREMAFEASNDSFPSRVVAAAASSISAVFQQVVNNDSENSKKDSSQQQKNCDKEHEPNKSKISNIFCERAMDIDEDDDETDVNATNERTKRSISITGDSYFD